MSELATIDDTAPSAPRRSFDLAPANLEEAQKYATLIAQSELAPKDYRGKPGNVLVAVQMGAELGLAPMQALQNIAVINGRPSVWGDALMALVRSNALCEWWEEGFDDDTQTGWARTKRRGDRAPREYTFTIDDAQLAGLLNKQGPWKQYPNRMCMLRARGFLARDVYADVLKGLISAEEAADLVPAPSMQAVEVIEHQEPESRTAGVREKIAQRRQAQAQAAQETEAPAETPTEPEVEPKADGNVERVLQALTDAETQDQLDLAMDDVRELDGDGQRKAAPFVSAARKRIAGE